MSKEFIHTDKNKFMTVPKNHSACCCKKCEKFFPVDKNPDLFGDMRTLQCPSCGTVYTYPPERIFILHKEMGKLSMDTCYQTRWYHATTNPNWLEEVQSTPNLMVHVGSEESAQDMANARLKQGNNKVYIHWLTLSTDTLLDPEFVVDTNDWVDYYDPDIHEYNTYRYVNDFEHPGSVSLLVKADTLVGDGRAVLSQ